MARRGSATTVAPAAPAPARYRYAPKWLLGVVLVAHVGGMEWIARHTSGQGVLQHMAEPAFNLAMPMDSTPPDGTPPPADTRTLPPATPTVGQVIQARTVQAPLPVQTPQPTAPVTHRHTQPPAARQPAVQTPTQATRAQQASVPDTLPAQMPTTVTNANTAMPLAGDTPHAPAHAATDTPPGPQPTAHATHPAPTVVPPQPADAAPAEKRASGAATPAQAALPEPPATAQDDAVWLATWPRSTRLTYQLKGYYRGDFYGSARVQWQRDAQRYQAQVHVTVALLFDLRMTSQGRITATRLWPEVYEEARRGKRRGVRFGDQVVTLDHGGTLNRPAHLQDTASQFVQLAQDFATRRQPLELHATVPVTLGRPGGVDDWLYDVVALETVVTPLGDLAAYHLKPRPLPNPRGKVSAEIWFAPALQHLPVRIKLSLDPETWLDLTLDSVTQSD